MRSSLLQFSVLSPGLFTTVQDNGRFGYQKFGIPVTGVLDGFAARIANFLVGNDSNSALLEMTVGGPRLFVVNDAFVAVTGADLEITLNGETIPTWEAFRVRPGDILEIGGVRSGCRGYLAVTGGIAVPSVMGSRSCYLGGKLGGFEGRVLQAGDKIQRGPGVFVEQPRKLPRDLIPGPVSEIVLRAIPGPQDDYFDADLEKFFKAKYVVSQDANRMGYRLDGPKIRRKEGMPASIISESSFPGGVQIPPNGLPIILLGEQTVGGYAKIATVISSDLDRIGQASPGDTIRFQKVDLKTAHAIKKEKNKALEKIERLIELAAQLRQWQQDNQESGGDNALLLFQELYPGC